MKVYIKHKYQLCVTCVHFEPLKDTYYGICKYLTLEIGHKVILFRNDGYFINDEGHKLHCRIIFAANESLYCPCYGNKHLYKALK